MRYRYEAYPWDHKMGTPLIRWAVLRHSINEDESATAQESSVRKDVAYFLHAETAEHDAKTFAQYKNEQAAR